MAVGLGFVQGEVGVAHDLLDRPAIGEGQPGGRPDRDLVACDVIRAGDRLLGMGCEHERAIVADSATQQDRELVAAEASHQAVVDRGPQPVRDLYEQGVTGGVSAGVVDSLEAVEVHEDDRGRAVDLQLFAQRSLEAESVGQPGEHVVACGDLHPAQHLHGVADVAHREDEAVGGAAALGVELAAGAVRSADLGLDPVPGADRHLLERGW